MSNRHKFEFHAGGNWNKMVIWCQENLYHGGHYEPKWYTGYPYLYFDDETEYTAFLLRWA